MGVYSAAVAKEGDRDTEKPSRMFYFATEAFKEGLQVFLMREQRSHDIMEQGLKTDGQMTFFVEQSHDAVFSASQKTAREVLKRKMEHERAAKMLAWRQIDQEGKKREGRRRGCSTGMSHRKTF